MGASCCVGCVVLSLGNPWRAAGSAAKEVEQGGVDLVGMRPGDGVRAALDHDQADVFDQVRQAGGGLVQRQHLVRVSVDDEDGHVDLGQVVAEVGGPGADAGDGG